MQMENNLHESLTLNYIIYKKSFLICVKTLIKM